MKKNKLFVVGTTVLTALLTLSACGGAAGGNGPSEKDTYGDISAIQNDIVIGDEGKVEFEEEVDLKVWSIIGDPDQVVFRKLIDKFNDEYMGQIHLSVTYQGHYDYYNALDTTWANDRDDFPDVCFMHNEKTSEYAHKGYLYALDELFDKTTVDIDFSNVYTNIDRVTKYKNHRFAVPVDGHGFVTQFRQDIIKHNNLGFDNNTRFIPNSRAEYATLLQSLRDKADAGTLEVRDINKGQNHAWKTVNKDQFYPSFVQSTDPDGLSALYANGGSMLNDSQDTVTFHQNEGFKTYLTDQVERTNAKLIGDGAGTNTEGFGKGNYVMFSEGPWWVSQTYSLSYNNSDLTQEGNGVTAADAADPIISKPYTASRPDSWWTLDANKDTENGSKWYGNGHAISLTKHVTSMQKAAAALTFMKWYTQSQVESTGDYNLATWCNSGHIPAWKNVYESEGYKALMEKNLTLRALGDPANLMAMEGLEYESTVFNGVGGAVSSVQAKLKTEEGCTKDQAIQILNETAESTQGLLDLLLM